jgi:hypothetical protein
MVLSKFAFKLLTTRRHPLRFFKLLLNLFIYYERFTLDRPGVYELFFWFFWHLGYPVLIAAAASANSLAWIRA